MKWSVGDGEGLLVNASKDVAKLVVREVARQVLGLEHYDRKLEVLLFCPAYPMIHPVAAGDDCRELLGLYLLD